jgi:magnesium-transporting ATPase (P-type)
VEGRDLPDDDELLAALVDRDGIVLARIDPEHKLRIAEALQRRGHVVAMTGDGVNDGPALQAADIGIAMGSSGTDVAREASDLVLLEEDFAVIVGAVEQGRATFANIRRFLTYHLAANVAELVPFLLWALSGSRFPLMIGVLQVISIDIATDTLPAVALGAEPPGAHLLDRPPIGGRLLDRRVAARAFGWLGPAVAAMETAAFLVSLVGSGWRAGEPFPGGATLAAASGAAWLAIVVGQVANAFNCRSSVLPAWRRGWFTNRLLLAALAGEAVIVAVLIGVPPVADLLGQQLPTTWGWAMVVAAFPVVIAVDAVDKARRNRRRRLQAQELHDAVVPARGVAAVHGDGLPGHERRVV